MSEINIPSDDKLSSILRAVERVEEKQHNEIEEMKGQLKTFGETWDTAKTRLEILEDKGVNPFQRDLTTNEARRDALKKWLVREYQWSFMNAEERANNQIDEPLGSGLVPEEVAPEIDRIVEEAGVARSLCRIVPMTSDTTYLNALSAGPLVYHPTEGQAPADSTSVFSRVQLDAKKMIATDQLSFEITEDAPQLVQFLVDVFGEAVAKEEDRIVFAGDESADPFTGFVKASTLGAANNHAEVVNSPDMAATKDAFADVAYGDIVDLAHAVDDNVVNRGTFVVSPSALGQIRKIVDSTSGIPIWASFAAGQEPTILGRPYVVANQFPGVDGAAKPFAMYGDFSHAYMGMRSGFQVAFSDDAGFTSATRYMRILQRWAFAIPSGTAFAVLRTAAS